MSSLSREETIPIRAAANRWISENFPTERMYIRHIQPQFNNGGWIVPLVASVGKQESRIGALHINADGDVLYDSERHRAIEELARLQHDAVEEVTLLSTALSGRGYDFRLGDGIAGARKLDDFSVPLLLTDPPYGISSPYTSESQVQRRLRKNGADFIMPRGDFGSWDQNFSLKEWTDKVLPKIGGWAVIFCAQAQIGEYIETLKGHRFVAVGTMVWQKTNPVPFNHTHKPINAWEAIVIGKRSGTKFNGRVVHNVFVCKSPSPQERIHPTQKPVQLLAQFVELFSAPGDLVFDPFAGSGSTVLAATQMGRRAIGYEKDKRIFAAAADRLTAKIGLM